MIHHSPNLKYFVIAVIYFAVRIVADSLPAVGNTKIHFEYFEEVPYYQPVCNDKDKDIDMSFDEDYGC